MADYRPIPDADEDAFRELVQYAFSPENGPYDPDSVGEAVDVGDRRGLYDDGLVAVCRHYEFPVRLRGNEVTTGGVGVVGSDPARRREGNVRELLTASLAEYRDRGWRLATLWPFDVGFYGSMGWATVSKLATWEAPPAALDGLAAERPASGQFERLAADDWERVVPVQQADHDTALALRRSEAWWREFVFDRWDGTPYVYGWVVDGDVRGYLVYDFGDDGDTFAVREQAALDAAARRQLFRFCRDHDSQVDRVRFYTTANAVAGEGFDPHLYLDDPGAWDATVTTGAMTRLVDVAADLPAIAGSAVDGQSARFDLVVSDPVAAWNDATFRVTVGDGRLRVERHAANDEATANRADDVPVAELSVGALSQVAVGFRSVETLAKAGRITGDEAAVRALGDCFPPGRPAVRENF